MPTEGNSLRDLQFLLPAVGQTTRSVCLQFQKKLFFMFYCYYIVTLNVFVTVKKMLCCYCTCTVELFSWRTLVEKQATDKANSGRRASFIKAFACVSLC